MINGSYLKRKSDLTEFNVSLRFKKQKKIQKKFWEHSTVSLKRDQSSLITSVANDSRLVCLSSRFMFTPLSVLLLNSYAPNKLASPSFMVASLGILTSQGSLWALSCLQITQRSVLSASSSSDWMNILIAGRLCHTAY